MASTVTAWGKHATIFSNIKFLNRTRRLCMSFRVDYQNQTYMENCLSSEEKYE
jgi:hypothetical protein